MRRYFFIGVALAANWAASSLQAKILTFDDLNCRCEVPDTWIQKETKGDQVHVVDIPQSRSFELRPLRSRSSTPAFSMILVSCVTVTMLSWPVVSSRTRRSLPRRLMIQPLTRAPCPEE